MEESILDYDVELRQHYRDCFSTKSGKIVLEDILRRCYFFNNDLAKESPEALGKHNFVMETLELLGCLNKPFDNTKQITEYLLKALTSMPIVD